MKVSFVLYFSTIKLSFPYCTFLAVQNQAFCLQVLIEYFTFFQNFLVFLALRGLVGIGEASYSTIAPTIIADLFVKTKRSRMLSVFYFATPVGR